MPELPEVETWRRLAERKATGRVICEVQVAEDRIVMDETPPVELARLLRGRKISGTGRRGKHMWMMFDRPGHLYLHYGMSGSLTEHAPGEGPTHAKLALALDDGMWLTYRNPRRIGKIRFYENALTARPVAALGPDPLIERLDPIRIEKAFTGKKRPIKNALLDQRLFAGVGNWIADEVLYQAKISPYRHCGDLSRKDIQHLLQTLHHILVKAVEVEADDSRFPDSWLFHHRWGKQAERTGSGERIQFDTLGGRTCAWAPKRQV